MAIAVENFGEFEGRRVDQFTLKGAGGVEVDIINYGVAVRDWRVPVKGGIRQVVLGFDDFPAYASHSPHLGSLAGRVANRIGGASFEIDGKTYKLPANERDAHAARRSRGPRAASSGRPSPTAAKNAVRFTHRSPDGAMGFPGNVEFTAVYSLSGKHAAARHRRAHRQEDADQRGAAPVLQPRHHRHGARPPLPARLQRLHRDRRGPDPDRRDPAGGHTQYDLKTERSLRDRAGKPDEVRRQPRPRSGPRFQGSGRRRCSRPSAT